MNLGSERKKSFSCENSCLQSLVFFHHKQDTQFHYKIKEVYILQFHNKITNVFIGIDNPTLYSHILHDWNVH